ncbi:hypothetical protein HYC85_013522 [Camellia sinensis]|uniref:Mur ligase C-terminal domain-containing protein n=1 Tax=Camellia sinensis TaxID=4442 RepID=A0A7J7H4X8_CAMSI|nr:hypothetical protein HYC85_013522 [Camellia sinensis]
MKIFRVLSRRPFFTCRETPISATGTVLSKLRFYRCFSAISDDSELKDFMEYLDNLKNYEKSGVPKGAGTDSKDGFDLSRMRRLMELLGNPQSKFKDGAHVHGIWGIFSLTTLSEEVTSPRMRKTLEEDINLLAVHIAGTKGKGSTAAFLSNILRAEGYSVGCYTRYALFTILCALASFSLSSPHIQTIRERILVGRSSEPVAVKALNSLFQRIKKDLDQAMELENGCLSHFEVFTAIAFSLFAQEKVDIAVIEAGLGGARDATNIISSSGLAVSVITTVGAEHLAALGGSLESIAIAKSGIIKHGRPVRCSTRITYKYPWRQCMLLVIFAVGSGGGCRVVLGGPLLPHIEHILRDKACSMSSTVVSACDPGNRSAIKGLSDLYGKRYQSCDIVIQIEDFQQVIELFDVKLSMLGSHQLQNAATATCASLCLRDQGWTISDVSIRSGLEQTYLLGRSQFLKSKEAEALGLSGATILIDGAHTKDSAKALADTIQMTFPKAKLVLVVAMASDKDHLGFARELLSVRKLEAIFLTEVDIAGDKARMTPASLLKDSWIQASKEAGINILDYGVTVCRKLLEDQSVHSANELESKTILSAEMSLMDAMRVGNKILRARTAGDDQSGIIVVTGSLHIVSSVLGLIQG